jgi:aarF domain-containing kinase
LGVASLAQVHRATLKNGKEVAVKVQHHYVRGNAKVDIVTMEYCVKAMSWIFPDFKFQWLVDESKKNLPVELDFMQEGRNTEKVSVNSSYLHHNLPSYFRFELISITSSG